MDYSKYRQRFGARLQSLRSEHNLTQEQLAEAIQKSTEHISFMERGERSPSFETLFDLSNVFNTTVADLINEAIPLATTIVEPISTSSPESSLPDTAIPSESVQEIRLTDMERFNHALTGLREMQQLATEYGISDILQDNGGKVLQVLMLLGLKMSPGREGNDAVDSDGNEYELKTVNKALNRNAGITTHHHLNKDIINKYRAVKYWYIAIYDSIELKEIYRVLPSELELLFGKWEHVIESRGKELNNPKIPMHLVKKAQRVFPK